MSGPPPEEPIEAIDLARALALAALDKKAYDVVILDLRGLVDFTDLFVLCTARNTRQVKAIAQHLKQVAKRDHGVVLHGLEGMEACRWVLLDLPGVVVHVFEEPMRGFYDLDRLWRDAPRLEVPDAAPPSATDDDDDDWDDDTSDTSDDVDSADSDDDVAWDDDDEEDIG